MPLFLSFLAFHSRSETLVPLFRSILAFRARSEAFMPLFCSILAFHSRSEAFMPLFCSILAFHARSEAFVPLFCSILALRSQSEALLPLFRSILAFAHNLRHLRLSFATSSEDHASPLFYRQQPSELCQCHLFDSRVHTLRKIRCYREGAMNIGSRLFYICNSPYANHLHHQIP